LTFVLSFFLLLFLLEHLTHAELKKLIACVIKQRTAFFPFQHFVVAYRQVSNDTMSFLMKALLRREEAIAATAVAKPTQFRGFPLRACRHLFCVVPFALNGMRAAIRCAATYPPPPPTHTITHDRAMTTETKPKGCSHPASSAGPHTC
jgi:hypothetical protein